MAKRFNNYCFFSISISIIIVFSKFIERDIDFSIILDFQSGLKKSIIIEFITQIEKIQSLDPQGSAQKTEEVWCFPTRSFDDSPLRWRWRGLRRGRSCGRSSCSHSKSTVAK
jgi:hypothetical protein